MQVVVLLLLVASLALLVSGLITGGTPLVVTSIVASVLAAYAISRYRNRQPATGRSGTRSAAPAPTAPAEPPAAPAEPPAAPPGRPAVLAGASRSAGRVAGPVATGPEPVPTGSEPAAGRPEHAVAGSADTYSQAAHRQETPHLAPGDPLPGGEGPDGESPDGEGPDGEGPDGEDPPVAETDPPLRSRGDEPVWVIDGRPRYHLAGCGFLLGRDPEPVPLRQAVEDGFTPCALCDPDSGLVAAANRG